MNTVVNKVEQKRVSISSKRQFTIPQKFFKELGFDREAICMVEDGKLVIVPARSDSGSEFAEQILTDLINEGYTGTDLLIEFKARQATIRPAVELMIEDAKKAANGEGEYMTYKDVFGKDE